MAHKEAAPASASRFTQLHRVWRIARWTPGQALSLSEANDLLALFRVHQTYPVPEAYRRLWILEEARALVALRGLQVNPPSLAARPVRLFRLAYSHMRLWLLLKALAAVEQAEASTGLTRKDAS